MRDKRETVNQQISLALIGFNVCQDIVYKGVLDELFKSDYILNYYPFESSFNDFMTDYYCKIEDCIYVDSLKSTRFPIQVIYDNIKTLNSEYEEMIKHLSSKIKSKDVAEFIINLLISCKTLILLQMKGELNLRVSDKKTILDLKNLTKYIICYYLKNTYILYEDKTDRILKELDIKISDYICKFEKNSLRL